MMNFTCLFAFDALEPFSYGFFRNGLVIATLAGALCGLIGVFVVVGMEVNMTVVLVIMQEMVDVVVVHHIDMTLHLELQIMQEQMVQDSMAVGVC